MRSFKNFPVEAFIFIGAGLGFLSWTAQVQFFRLNIESEYEHMIAYSLMALLIIASKGLNMMSRLETALVILLAASLEALKGFISFRHPKTSDFYADILGLGIGIMIGLIITWIFRTVRFILISTRQSHFENRD